MKRQPTNKTPLLEAALYYAERGLPVFPCRPRSKKPATPNGFKDATTDPEIIRAWWSKNPKYNIGLAIGDGLGVLDQDREKVDTSTGEIIHGDGQETRRDFEEKAGSEFPRTVSVKTGGGGRQDFYKLPDGVILKNSAEFREGCDTRGPGGYVVAPPSIHPSGARYEFMAGHGPDQVEIAPADELLLEFLRPAIRRDKTGSSTRSAAAPAPEKVPEGSRTSALISKIGRLTAAGLSPEAIRAAIREENEATCEPPLTDQELEREIFPAVDRWAGEGKTAAANFEDEDEEPRSKNSIIKAAEEKVPAGRRSFYRKRFYKWKTDKTGKASAVGVVDQEVERFIVEHFDFFLLGGEPYFLEESGLYKLDHNGERLKRTIEDCILPDLVRDATIRAIYNLVMIQDKRRDFSRLNQYPAEWIPFRNGLYDPERDELHEYRPEYFCINQIPAEYDPAAPEPEAFEKFLAEAIPEEDAREMLLEFMGLCMTRDTSPQKLLILRGRGGTGKSVLLRLLAEIIGEENVSAISLQNLGERFYPALLLGKLCNICADISAEDLKSTAEIKKAVGEDDILAEKKGKDAFKFRSYAKLIFSANTIPLNLDEKSDAFYRRLSVVVMDKKPAAPDRDLGAKLQNEKPGIVRIMVEALRRMYERGYLLESDQSREEVEALRREADSITAFLADELRHDQKARIKRTELSYLYEEYCGDNGYRCVSAHRLYDELRRRGYASITIHGDYYFKGLGKKDEDDTNA